MPSRIRCLVVFIVLVSILGGLAPFTQGITPRSLRPLSITLYVGGSGPNNYTRIQDAIDNATAGDTIYVYPGTYVERLLITKTLTLIGASAPETIIDGNGSGNVVKIQTAADVTVTDFTLQNGGIGAYLVQATRAHIHHTLITDNWEGIGLLNSTSCTLHNNRITHNGFEGINPVHTVGTSITNNLIVDHLEGIYLVGSTSSIVTNNTFKANSRGIEVRESSNSNQFYHNNFYSSEEDNAYDECTNTWDHGYPSGGNYWDDYHGQDNNHDGIGDTPYAIPGGNNHNRYPLMLPRNHAPDQPAAPKPSNGATNVFLNPALSVFVSDPNGDALSVSFYDASTHQLIGTVSNVPSLTRATLTWHAVSPYTQYEWYVVASDGSQSNQSQTWTFTNRERDEPAAHSPRHPWPCLRDGGAPL